MPAKGDRSAEREAPAGGARNSVVLGREGGPDGESDRAIVAKKPGNAGGAKGPAFRHASEAEEDQAIDLESDNAGNDPEPAEEAVSPAKQAEEGVVARRPAV